MNRSLHALLILASALTVSPLASQEPRLAQRLGAAAADSITRVIAAAEAEGLPGAPLRAKALEGASRGVAAPRVIQAVLNLAASLRDARALLGADRSVDELTAGAAALQDGVPRETLRQLAGARQGRSLAMPLVVLTDLVSRGVPSDTIAPLLTSVWRRGISDADLLQLRETISRDIAAGASPRDAALLRLGTLTADRLPRSGTTEGPRP